MMLQSKDLLRMFKDRAEQTIFTTIESILCNQTQDMRNTEFKLVNLIFDDENIVMPISRFIIKAYNNDKAVMKKLAVDTLIMLVDYILMKTNASTESQAVKNTKEVICECCQKITRLFYTNLSNFIGMYESGAYLLRNALTEIIQHVIRNILTYSEESEQRDQHEKLSKTRTKLFKKLLTRVIDKNAHARAKVLDALIFLCCENSIPGDFLLQILKAACRRIRDISAIVRKKALLLVQTTIRLYYYTFCESQSKDEFMSLEEVHKEQEIIEDVIAALDKKLMDLVE